MALLFGVIELERWSVVGRFESVAATDGGDDEVEVGVLGMTAFFGEVFWGLVTLANLHNLLIGFVVFAEVLAAAALSVVYGEHRYLSLWVNLRDAMWGDRCEFGAKLSGAQRGACDRGVPRGP